MVYIGTTNFTPKNRFGSVWTSTMDRKRPVLGGSVRFPQYLGWSWTGCGPQLPVLGAKNRTELDLRTLVVVVVEAMVMDVMCHIWSTNICYTNKQLEFRCIPFLCIPWNIPVSILECSNSAGMSRHRNDENSRPSCQSSFLWNPLDSCRNSGGTVKTSD